VAEVNRARILGLVLALVAVGFAGCVDGPDTVPEGELDTRLVANGQNSSIEDRRTVVVTDRASWEDLWNEHTGGGADHIPAIDFDERVAVGVFMGTHPDGCAGAEITSVTGLANGTIRVEGEWFTVNASECPEGPTAPHHVVHVPRYDTEVVFDMRETTREGPAPERR